MEMMLTVWVHGLAWRRYKRPTLNVRYQTPLIFLTTRNLARQQEEISKIIEERRRKVTTHLETSLIKTFRVGEGEVEVEDPEEEATNPTTEVGEDLHIGKGRDPHTVLTTEEIESTESGTRAKMSSRALASPMKKGCGMSMKNRWGTRRREMKEIPKATTPKSMRTGRGPEVQAQEGRDPAEMTEHMKEEITAKIGGETPI